MSARNRFPGTTYFKETDSDIFKGRDKEIESLGIRIDLNDTVVVHGESGIGKSSLIRAGLLPKLKEDENCIPVIIKFDNASADENKDNLLVEKTYNQIIDKIEGLFPTIKQDLPGNDLWELIKYIEYKNKHLILTSN